MRCGSVRDLFSRYLENAMDGNMTARFDEHLAGCESCRRALERFSATVAMLDSIPEVDPPADFHASVMAQVERARRTVPAPVKWWTVDWQHVFTIRVPARAAAVGFAVLLMFALAVQLFPPLRTGIAGLFWAQEPPSAPIADVDENAPKAPLPWNPKTSDRGLQISIAADMPGEYSVMLGTSSKEPVRFQIEVAGTKYSGFAAAERVATIKVPAPPVGSVAVVHVAWSIREWGRYQSVFLPAKLERHSSPKSFALENVTVRDVLRTVCWQYGVAIIASGDLGKSVPYAQVDHATPSEALYESLNKVGMKWRGIASSVYAIEPAR